MVLFCGRNQLGVDVDSDDLMSAPMQLCADAARAASAVENSRATRNDRIHQSRFASQIQAFACHLTKTFDVPLRMAFFGVAEPAWNVAPTPILPHRLNTGRDAYPQTGGRVETRIHTWCFRVSVLGLLPAVLAASGAGRKHRGPRPPRHLVAVICCLPDSRH